MMGYACGFLLGTSTAVSRLLPVEVAVATTVLAPLSCSTGLHPIRCAIVTFLRTSWCTCSTLLCKWACERWVKPVGAPPLPSPHSSGALPRFPCTLLGAVVCDV